MKRIKIYIAGPYTKPDPISNTNKAVLLATKLLDLGYVPFCPHLAMHWDYLTPRDYKVWLDYDLEWIPTCDFLFRIKGDSPGADVEVDVARSLGIPVVYSIDELNEYVKTKYAHLDLISRL